MKNNQELEEFCLLYQMVREAQNNYFASKKGNRFPTPESKKLLAISKKLEAELDLEVQEFLGKDDDLSTSSKFIDSEAENKEMANREKYKEYFKGKEVSNA